MGLLDLREGIGLTFFNSLNFVILPNLSMANSNLPGNSRYMPSGGGDWQIKNGPTNVKTKVPLLRTNKKYQNCVKITFLLSICIFKI